MRIPTLDELVEWLKDPGQWTAWRPLAGKKVVIGGAGIVGLIAAILFERAGSEVCIYEHDDTGKRSGGGLSVGKEALDIFGGVGIREMEEVTLTTYSVGYIDLSDPAPLLRPPFRGPRRYLAGWDLLHDALRSKLVSSKYLAGTQLHSVSSLRSQPSAVLIAKGAAGAPAAITTIKCDLLVLADGENSFGREYLFETESSNAAESYAGYLIWRGVVLFKHLPEHIQDMTRAIGDCRGDGWHFICHPIYVVDQNTGERSMAMYWDWSVNTPKNAVAGLLGAKYAQSSIRPKEVDLPDEATRWLNVAAAVLPDAASVMVRATKRSFARVIRHYPETPMVRGRAALVGDAAWPMPPHTGGACARGAEDAVELVASMTYAVIHQKAVDKCLADWAQRRTVSGRNLARRAWELVDEYGLGTGRWGAGMPEFPLPPSPPSPGKGSIHL